MPLFLGLVHQRQIHQACPGVVIGLRLLLGLLGLRLGLGLGLELGLELGLGLGLYEDIDRRECIEIEKVVLVRGADSWGGKDREVLRLHRLGLEAA